jgi:hypothetical protein
MDAFEHPPKLRASGVSGPREILICLFIGLCGLLLKNDFFVALFSVDGVDLYFLDWLGYISHTFLLD